MAGCSYRRARLARQDGPCFGFVHAEVLQVGLVDLLGQGFLIGQLRVLDLSFPR